MTTSAGKRRLTITIEAADLEWARTTARAESVSVSTLVSRALRAERQMRSRRGVITKLGLRSTPDQRDAARRERGT